MHLHRKFKRKIPNCDFPRIYPTPNPIVREMCCEARARGEGNMQKVQSYDAISQWCIYPNGIYNYLILKCQCLSCIIKYPESSSTLLLNSFRVHVSLKIYRISYFASFSFCSDWCSWCVCVCVRSSSFPLPWYFYL